MHLQGKTNLPHWGLIPAHVPFWLLEKATLSAFGVSIGRAPGSKSNVTMNAWLPQASYPCGNCSDYSSWIFLRPKGSIGHVFRVIRSLRLLMLLSEYIQGILIPISNCKLLLGTVYNRLTGRLTGNRFIWTGKRNRTEPNRTGVILLFNFYNFLW